MEENKKVCLNKKPEDSKEADNDPKEESLGGLPSAKPHMGIPKAHFVEDVDAFMALPENDGNADLVLRKFDEQHSKYKFMEYNLAAKRRRLKNQIPDFQKSIEMIQVLASLKEQKKELDTQFLLSEQVYMKASVPPTDKVLLWLGANVMLEYDLEEAMKLLKKNLAIAKKSLETVENDLDFLRDQFTTTEKINHKSLRNHIQEITPEPVLKAPPPTPCVSLKQRSGSVPDIRIVDIKRDKIIYMGSYHKNHTPVISYHHKAISKPLINFSNKKSTSDHAVPTENTKTGPWTVFGMGPCTSNLLHSVRQRLMNLQSL